jgi:hypothetical protein
VKIPDREIKIAMLLRGNKLLSTSCFFEQMVQYAAPPDSKRGAYWRLSAAGTKITDAGKTDSLGGWAKKGYPSPAPSGAMLMPTDGTRDSGPGHIFHGLSDAEIAKVTAAGTRAIAKFW